MKQGKQYDVFLSYAVSYDAKLVNDIYWQLSSLEVTSHGKKRKVRLSFTLCDACLTWYSAETRSKIARNCQTSAC